MDLKNNWEEFIKEGSDLSSVLLLIPGKRITLEIARSLASVLQEAFKVIVYTGHLPAADQVHSFTDQLLESLTALGIKRYTIFAEGSACNVAQVMALHSATNHTGAVRRLFLLNPQSRMSPTLSTKIIDRLESCLPLGLPLRPLDNNFDSRSTLHRLRCPTMLAVTPDAGMFLKYEAAQMHKRIPNSLLLPLKYSLPHSLGNETSQEQQKEAHLELLSLLHDLLQRPVKRPQKNLK